MHKSTIYIPDDLRKAVTRLAADRGISEAEVIREALRRITAEAARPRPRVGLFESGKPDLADRMDEALAGFGES